MGARTGVGTPFPLRLLAQTSALWRGVIFQGLPSSEIWATLYIIVYVYFGARNYSAADPTAALKSGQHFTARDARSQSTTMPFRLKDHPRGTPTFTTKDSPWPPARSKPLVAPSSQCSLPLPWRTARPSRALPCANAPTGSTCSIALVATFFVVMAHIYFGIQIYIAQFYITIN